MSMWSLGPNHPDYGRVLLYGTGATRPGGRKPSGRWAREHDGCKRCGRNDRDHAGHGLCRPCYSKAYLAGEFEAVR